MPTFAEQNLAAALGRNWWLLLLRLLIAALLIFALILFLRGRKDAPQGTPLPNGRGIMVLTFAGLILSLASQLPIFQ